MFVEWSVVKYQPEGQRNLECPLKSLQNCNNETMMPKSLRELSLFLLLSILLLL